MVPFLARSNLPLLLFVSIGILLSEANEVYSYPRRQTARNVENRRPPSSLGRDHPATVATALSEAIKAAVVRFFSRESRMSFLILLKAASISLAIP